MEEEEVELGDYLGVLWRRRYLVVLVTLACALAAFAVSKVMPEVYQATATLVLLPPRFSTELRAAPLSVEAYQSMAKSDYIVDKVRRELARKNIIRPGEEIGTVLTARARAGSNQPLIDLVVEADSPQKAEAIANTWAEVFVAESSTLIGRVKKGSLELIEKEYPAARQRLMEAEARLKETEDSYDRQIKAAEDAWDAKITDFRAEWKIESLKKQLASYEQELIGSIEKLHQAQMDIKRTKDTLEELRKEIKGHPQFITLSRSISDDALWDRAVDGLSSEAAKQLETLRLKSEQLNPVYHSLLQRLADTQVAYEALLPQEKYLQEQIAARRKEVEGLTRLILSKELELEKLKREKETALALLRRERDFRVSELKREVESLRGTYSTLAQKYEVARLAKAEEDPDVKVWGYAVAPKSPIRTRTMLNTAVALVTGLMLSVMLAFLLEYLQSAGGSATS